MYLAYATIEVGSGLWAASILVDHRRMDAQTAGLWVSCFFGAIMAGRFAIGLVAVRIGNRRLVQFGLVLALTGAAIFALDGAPTPLSLGGLILLGMGCAPVYPSLMHETTQRFAPEVARRVVGRQVAFAYLGAAVGPASLGLFAAAWGLGIVMPVVCVALLVLLLMSWGLDRVT